jgi:hypothetical protein
MHGIVFVATLFVMGASGLLLAAMAGYETIDFHLNGRAAQMQLAHPDKKIVVPEGGYDVTFVDVKYVGAAGEVVVPHKQLSGAVARRLANGGQVSVTYFKNDPDRVMYAGEQPPNPWGWLLLGVAGMGTFVYARKLLLQSVDA